MPELDLKPGDEAKFTVGGKELTLRPLPFGRMKKLLAIVVKVIEKMTAFDGLSPAEVMKKAPEIIGDSYAQVIPLLFDKKDYAFITEAWIEDNLTLPAAKEIALAAVKINGLEDFFGKTGPRVPATPAANGDSPSGLSTTSSPQPMAGQ